MGQADYDSRKGQLHDSEAELESFVHYDYLVSIMAESLPSRLAAHMSTHMQPLMSVLHILTSDSAIGCGTVAGGEKTCHHPILP